jgi:hypothetical protein
VPANRSRTLQWRRCLDQIFERNGAIEIAVARDYDETEEGRHLVWRVRVLSVTEDEIVVEQPMTLGQLISLRDGVALVAILAIGQNRWMFTTTNLGATEFELGRQRAIPAVRLKMPDTVRRCQRRNFYRVETAALNLPEVELWPLLDPKSVILAERANELEFERNQQGLSLKPEGESPLLDEKDVMPETGPRFTAMLMNIGGGGVGLTVPPDHAQALQRHKLFWMRFSLPPELETPICATAKLAHTHMQSDQMVYAGMSFDFSFNPGHQRFVVDQICKYIAVQQRSQFQRESESEARRTA